MSNDMKRCTKCSNPYPATLEYFHADKTKSDGLHCWCKLCRKNNAAQRYINNPEASSERAHNYYLNNKDEVLARNKEWAINNPDRYREILYSWRRNNPEKIRMSKRDYNSKRRHLNTIIARNYRANNREHYNAKDREYRERNRDRVRFHAAEARKRDPIRYRAYGHKRRELMRASGYFAKDDVTKQMEKQLGLCMWCSCPLEHYHIDHVHPISRGGSNTADNIVLACPHCNQSKSDKLVYTEWQPPNPLISV